MAFGNSSLKQNAKKKTPVKPGYKPPKGTTKGTPRNAAPKSTVVGTGFAESDVKQKDIGGFTKPPVRDTLAGSGTGGSNAMAQSRIKDTTAGSGGGTNGVGPYVKTPSNKDNGSVDGDGDGVTGTRQTKTAFGNTVRPDAYSAIWEDPEALIRAYYNHKGYASNTGSEAMVQQLQPSLGIQWMLAEDARQNSKDPLGAAEYIDWAGQYLQNMGTPGGKTLDPGYLMQTLMNPQSDALKQQLTADSLTKGDQVGNFKSAYQYAMQPTLPTPVLNAMLAKIESMGTDFRADGYTKPDGSPSDVNFLKYMKMLGFGV